MRINVYTEELWPEKGPQCEIVTAKYISSRTGDQMTNYGLRVYLRSHPDLHFVPGRDDDRSAVTFWCGSSNRGVLQLVEMMKGVAEQYNLEHHRAKVQAAAAEAEKNLGSGFLEQGMVSDRLNNFDDFGNRVKPRT